MITGSYTPVFPEGEQGKLSIVYRALIPDDRDRLYLVLRNNTGGGIGRIDVMGAAYQAGKLYATGRGQAFEPRFVEPGGLAYGYVYFAEERLTADLRSPSSNPVSDSCSPLAALHKAGHDGASGVEILGLRTQNLRGKIWQSMHVGLATVWSWPA